MSRREKPEELKIKKGKKEDGKILSLPGVHPEDFSAFCGNIMVKKAIVLEALRVIPIQRITKEDEVLIKDMDDLEPKEAQEEYAKLLRSKITDKEIEDIKTLSVEEIFMKLARYTLIEGTWSINKTMQDIFDTYMLSKGLAEQKLLSMSMLVWYDSKFAKFLGENLSNFTRDDLVKQEEEAAAALETIK